MNRVALPEETVLDVSGAAQFLGVSERTVGILARQHGLPAEGEAHALRFHRSDIKRWLSSQSESLTPEERQAEYRGYDDIRNGRVGTLEEYRRRLQVRRERQLVTAAHSV